ncbi:hypothetical protein [Saccharopolyspora mangrovi]|uniref:DUF2269 domain-containing protein n=1 Tax=Saccharopolyspora mangrovi TaxID=3082379 RepID=A0ABU6A2V7_9PSEU|nr:hypothetical protein [Saccharopolyspora sp. S2-29]MEB3365906.1 hypothetical protein [Saccharopolyspora sp. S2-29]
MASSQRWRQALVWLHVVTSVGWMAQALVLFTLLSVSFGSAQAGVRVSATTMAHVVDTTLLAPAANAAAFTGFVLAAATPWGFFRNWWVLVKFGITVAQLYAGIFILSAALQASVVSAEAGRPTPPVLQLVGTALMASAIAFQAWLSVAKPWRRTPWASVRKIPAASDRVFAAAVFAPVADIALGLAVGFPAPLFELIVLIVVLARRPRRIAAQPRPETVVNR